MTDEILSGIHAREDVAWPRARSLVLELSAGVTADGSFQLDHYTSENLPRGHTTFSRCAIVA